MATDDQTVAIVGGGFSGAMLAARLAERGVASTLIERSGTFGPGLAYSTGFDGHLLNVRSGRMGAIEGRPEGFVRWLEAHYPDRADPEGFAPRRLYGEYLQARLAAAEAAHPGRVRRLAATVDSIAPDGLRLADGRRIPARAVVLATGNPTPKTITSGVGPGAGDRVVGNPWRPGALEGIGSDDDVLLVGAGLTMVDMVLELLARGWRGKATVLSRRGLKPRSHGPHHDAPRPPTGDLLTGPLSARLAAFRRLAADGDWRGVMEGLRPITADLWAAADMATRSRFLRRLRPWWDVHRHRIPGDIAATLAALEAEGRLDIRAGHVDRIDRTADGVAVEWRPRGGPAQPPLQGAWLIDCTGPGHDAESDPLIGPLIASGRARLDPLGLGVELDADGRVLGADGAPAADLFVLGPPARAAFWETIAVPDIRKRIETLADRLAPAEA